MNIEEINIIRQNIASLTRRAAIDREFRDLCLKDADAAYAIQNGRPLPEGLNVRFIERALKAPVEKGARCVRLPGFIAKTWLN